MSQEIVSRPDGQKIGVAVLYSSNASADEPRYCGRMMLYQPALGYCVSRDELPDYLFEETYCVFGRQWALQRVAIVYSAKNPSDSVILENAVLVLDPRPARDLHVPAAWMAL